MRSASSAPMTKSIAAPTAGLHFTHELLESLKSRGIGIARVTHTPGAAGTGEILGTVEYMSPEQASGDPMDHRLARILLTLSDVDQHLDEFSSRMSELRTDARQAQVQGLSTDENVQ